MDSIQVDNEINYRLVALHTQKNAFNENYDGLFSKHPCTDPIDIQLVTTESSKKESLKAQLTLLKSQKEMLENERKRYCDNMHKLRYAAACCLKITQSKLIKHGNKIIGEIKNNQETSCINFSGSNETEAWNMLEKFNT